MSKKMIGWSVANGILEGKRRLCANYGGASLRQVGRLGEVRIERFDNGGQGSSYIAAVRR